MTTVICLDTEYDARYTDLGVARLACMTYSFGPEQLAAIAGPAKAVDLWLTWVNDPSVIFLGHSLYHDFAVLAQEAYFRTEKTHCIPGQGWAWELAHRLYDPVFSPSFPGDELRASLRVVDTEIRQRLTQVRFGPHKASVRLGDLAKMLFGEDRSDAKDVPDEAQALLRAAVPYSDWPDDVLAKTPWRVLFGYLVVRALLWLVRGFSLLPSSWSRRFASALDAVTRPFHVVNYLGSLGGARVLGHAGMERAMDRVTASLVHTLEHSSEKQLERGMHFPVGWDPYFRDFMTLQDVLHYGTQHYEHHRRQLTLSNAGNG